VSQISQSDHKSENSRRRLSVIHRDVGSPSQSSHVLSACAKDPDKWFQRYFRIICTGQLILTANTVVVAMSGGVDSSVTAKLLAEKVRRTLRTFFTLTDTFYLGLRPFCHIHAQLGHS
jgi:asparagine synthetase B (glutamine-hydrolysing)